MKNIGKSLGGLLFVVWGATILILSLHPSPPVISYGFIGWDKFQHASAYLLLTLLGYSALSNKGGDKRRKYTAVAFAIFFGALIEVAQGVFTTTRQSDYMDSIANGVGAVVAFCVVTLYRKVTNNNK